MTNDPDHFVESFKPIASQDARVLILGSMPGAESLRQQQYYANSANHFWRVVYAVFDGTPHAKYEDRIAFIQSKGIALWDVLRRCRREGSLDANIRQAEVNDFQTFFAQHPNIRFVAVNGSTAFKYLRKNLRFEDYPHIRFELMPSTSAIPRRGMVTVEDKLGCWRAIAEYLE